MVVYCESMKKPLEVIVLTMAAFGDGYYSAGGMIGRATSSLIGWGKYAYYPEERAKRIVELIKKASVEFCRSFWLLNENQYIQQLSSMTYTPIPVNKVLHLPPNPLTYHCQDSKIIEIPAPSSHLPSAPVICRLLSSHVREGQIDVIKPPTVVMPPSPYLIIHCHGGGFVAQSSKSHEVYLQEWIRNLDVPLLSIDYSLAPKAPYPRPFEECFFAYVWALENCHQLGSTGEKICLVGDSAGGTLILSVALKAIDLGIRLPDGLLPIYTPVDVSLRPTPSRMLSIMDPLVPFGFLIRCFAAYLGDSKEAVCQNDLNNTQPNSEITSLLSKSDSGVCNDKSSSSEQNGSPKTNFHSSSHCKAKEIVTTNSLNEEPRNYASTSVMHSNSNCESLEEVSDVEFRNLEVLSAENGNSNTLTVTNSGDECDAVVKNMEYNDFDLNEWYLLDVDKNGSCAMLRSESAESEENIVFEIPLDISKKISDKVVNVTDKVLNSISDILPFKRKTEEEKRPTDVLEKKGIGAIFSKTVSNDCKDLKTLLKEFKNFTTDSDYYVSPYLAPDAVIQLLPPVHFMCCVLDPCLDDSVMFAKRLQRLNKKVGIDILDGLPHGFLNFTLVSKDAADGSKLCIHRLRQLLGIPISSLQNLEEPADK